jgi:hypothetical protein
MVFFESLLEVGWSAKQSHDTSTLSFSIISARRPGKNVYRESLHVSVGIGEPYSTLR